MTRLCSADDWGQEPGQNSRAASSIGFSACPDATSRAPSGNVKGDEHPRILQRSKVHLARETRKREIADSKRVWPGSDKIDFVGLERCPG